MSLASVQGPSPFAWVLRTSILAVSVVFCLMLSTSGVGGQESDDHGDTLSTASNLTLGSSIEGRIDPADDQDVFRLDLSRASGITDVWIYTTGELNTVGLLFDSNADLLTGNHDSLIVGRWTDFHIRASLRPGVYYVVVISYKREYIGDYSLQAEEVTDLGNNTIDTAARLSLDSPTPGDIDTANGADYYRLEFNESKNLVIYAVGVNAGPVDVVVLDPEGTETTTNVYPFPDSVFGLPRYGFWIRDDFDPGTYYVRIFTLPGVDSHPVPYTIHAFEDVQYTDFIDGCEASTRQLNDPLIGDSLYACQWHLDSQHQGNVNVEPVWEEGIKGDGINVAVVDDGMYYAHEDLNENVDATRNHDYLGNGDIYTPFEHHGTHVAGLIAARDNDIGVRGVAPRATVYGYNLLVDPTFFNRADAMGRNNDVTAVSANSWGHLDGPWLSPAMAFWTRAIETGINDGYGGKGVLYVFAGGNGHVDGDNSNLDEYNNHYGVTSVCAVNDHDTRSGISEMGANLWVCAPSNDRTDLHQGILTTENSDRYYEEFGGTSASTPIVSGVAALMRSANRDLTWRDVKLILAASARKNDDQNSGWQDGARKYGSTSDSERYHFNHEYGFGVVDAKAAVDLAKGWRNLPPLESSTLDSNRLNLAIPDSPRIGPPATVATSLRLNTSMKFVEFVEINGSFRHNSFRDLKVELESPSGAVSELSVPFDTRTDDDPSLAYVPLNGTFRFGSAKHLGEDPNGAWKLRVTDYIPTQRGRLDSWSIKVYGHESRPDAPTVDSVTPGVGDLKVAWNAPSETGSSPVSAYDLRYIQTAADETVDTNWTALEGVWNIETGSSLEYVITSLVGGVRYDVQVRAANRAGAGPWSETVAGTTIQVTSGTCGTDGAVADPANNPGLVFDCNALLAARDALAGSATLNWTASTPIAEWLGVIVGGSPQRVTELDLHDAELNGAIPTELNRLDNLKRLVLRENELTGPIPDWLGDLANLEELSLWGNRLSGPIPMSLGNLVNMEDLLLSRNPLSGSIPAELGDLANLRELRLFNSQLTGPIPTELGRLANLKVLVLSNNQLTGSLPLRLGDLASLQALSLLGNRLTGPIPAELGNLANLKELKLSQNQLTGPIPASLGNLANLEELSLWRNRLTGSIPAEIGDLINLEQLLLRENSLTGSIPASLGDLDNLQGLSLRQNQLDGCVPQGLRDVASNDFDDLDLPFCDVLLGSLNISPGRLVQKFDPYRTDYTALASGTRVTLTASNQHNATVMFLDSDDREIADADTSLVGHQVDLRTGITVVKVKVTSHDGRSIYTYTVAVNRVPTSPVIDAVTSGESQLTVSWTAPDETGGSDIVAYDLRYIQTGAGETGDSEWAVVENVWAAAIGGDLQYAIGGLTGSTPYDVQVRALNRTGAGPWSATTTGLTAISTCVTGGAVSDTTNTGLISDCEALLEARDTLAGTGSLDWSADTPIGRWEGVSLRETPQRVTWLALSFKGLDGTIPSELGRLEMLVHLNLRSNDLTGSIPALLGNLSNLTYLNLHSNDLSGGFPDLSRISGLAELYLANNADYNEDGSKVQDSGLTGGIPTWLNDMTDMRELWLWGNSLSGSIPDLSGMTSLERLKLANNRLMGGVPEASRLPPNMTWLIIDRNPLGGEVPDLSSLSSLRLLWLHSNRLTGAIPTGDMFPTSLDDLNLRDNLLTGTIPNLSNLDNLTRLRLHNNSLIGEVPATLGGLNSLKQLWLHNEDATKTDYGNNSFTGIAAGVGDLSDTLIEIALRGNSWSEDACVPAALRNVATNDYEEADLAICGEEAIRDLESEATTLRHYVSADETVSESDTEVETTSVGKLTNPKDLLLHDNQLNGSIPSALGQLSNLGR